MEYICKKFTLDRGNKLDLRLDSAFELPGNQWYCGLKEFSLEQKWSLANEDMTIIYQNGKKSLVKPGYYHSVAQIDKVLEEMFPEKRQKRAVIGIGEDDDDDEVQDQVIIYEEEDDDEMETDAKQKTEEKIDKSSSDKDIKPTDKQQSVTDKKLSTTDKDIKATDKTESTTDKNLPATDKDLISTDKTKTEKPKSGPEAKTKEVKSDAITPTQPPIIPTTEHPKTTEPESGKSLREQIETNAQYVQKDKGDFIPPWNKKRKTEQVQTHSWNAPDTVTQPPKAHKEQIEANTDYIKHWDKSNIEDKEKVRNPPVSVEHIVEGHTPKLPPASAFVWDSDSDDEDAVDDKTEVEHPQFPSSPEPEKTEEKSDEKQPETEHPQFPSSPEKTEEKGDKKTEDVDHPQFPTEELDIEIAASDTDDSDDDKVIVIDDERDKDVVPTADTTTMPPPAEPTIEPTMETITLPTPMEESEETIPPILPTESPIVTPEPVEEQIPDIFVDPYADPFTKAGFESIKFTRNLLQKYVVKFDPKYVSAIQLSDGFAKALGFTRNYLLMNDTTALDSPSFKTSASHICISVKNILRPLTDEKDAEIGTIPINDKEKVIQSYFSLPMWFKLETTRIDTISLEFTDFFGNPIACDNAHGHFALAFVNHKR